MRSETTTLHEVYLTEGEARDILAGGIYTVETESGEKIEVSVEPDDLNLSGASRQEFDVPEVGEHLLDPEAPRWSSGEVRIEEVTDIPAEDFEITVQGIDTTVFRENPTCSPDAPVVKARYVGGSGTEYAFPVDRLER